MIKCLLSRSGLISGPLKPKTKLILVEFQGLTLLTPSLVILIITHFQRLMVTGGFDGSYLDTTEVHDNHWRTVAGKLPFVMGYMRATTLSNRVLLFGNHYVLVLRIYNDL